MQNLLSYLNEFLIFRNFVEEIIIGLLLTKIILFFKNLATIDFFPFLSYPLLEKTINFVNFTIFFQLFHLWNFIRLFIPLLN